MEGRVVRCEEDGECILRCVSERGGGQGRWRAEEVRGEGNGDVRRALEVRVSGCAVGWAVRVRASPC